MIQIIEDNGRWAVVDGDTVKWFGYPWAAKSYSLYLRTQKAEAEVGAVLAA